MAEQNPKAVFAVNETVSVTMKFDSGFGPKDGQYGQYYIHTVEIDGEDHTLFADADSLQLLIDAASPARGVELAIRKDQPAGQKHPSWKLWRAHEGEWIEVDARDAPSRAPETAPVAPKAPSAPSGPQKAPAAPKQGVRPDLLSPVMAECLNQAAICYGYGSWAALMDLVMNDAPPEGIVGIVDLVQRLSQSLFIASTNDRTVLPPAAPMADYEAPGAPVDPTEQKPDQGHADSEGDDDLPF